MESKNIIPHGPGDGGVIPEVPQPDPKALKALKETLYGNGNRRPKVPAFQKDGIPAALRALARWVPWKLNWKADKKKPGKGKWDKIPLDPNTFNEKSGYLRWAKSNDPATWAGFDAALDAASKTHKRDLQRPVDRKGVDGLGFTFARPTDATAVEPTVFGLDIDACRDPKTGEMTPLAARIVREFATFTDRSPSDMGVKLIGYGRLPWAKGRKVVTPTGEELELYDHERFFTLTGRQLDGTPNELADCQPALDALIAEFFPTEENAPKPAKGKGRAVNPDLAPDDARVVELICRRHAALWNGDTSRHGDDDSRADLALCDQLAFFCHNDADRIDRLFRQSGLMRDKWDRADYREKTIGKATEGRTEFYDPGYRSPTVGRVTLNGQPGAGPRGAPVSATDESESETEPATETTNPTPSVDAYAQQSSPHTDSGYIAITGLGTYHCDFAFDPQTGQRKVSKQTKLSNFIARVTGETVTDDGVDQTREFAVTVEHPSRAAVTVSVPVEKFAAMDWPVDRLGFGYIIQAGRGTKDQLRHAIQELSGDDVRSSTKFAHTGWREVDGQWTYLHAGGAIGDVSGVSVRLDGAAAGFVLPTPQAGEVVRAAVRASLRILDGLAPDAVAFPLLAATYRAPLGGADYGVWLNGPTGSQKSELLALAQQHYGAGMTRTHLPGSWSSTENALEGLAFTLKDAVFVVDDFAPPTSRADMERRNKVAERLVRGQGNGAGRQRMRADGTLRPPKPPRGLFVTSAEDVPQGHSIAARLSIISIRRGAVNLSRLSACQRDAGEGKYAAAMAGYLAWLAPRYATVRAGLDAERVELRNQFVGKFPHARTPDIVANQLIGLRHFLRFAVDIGAVSEAERVELWRRGRTAFVAVADSQTAHQHDTDPVAQFPAAIRGIVSSGRGFIAGPDGGAPNESPSPVAWGYEERDARGTFDTRPAFVPRGKKLGWVEGGVLMLDPEPTYAAVVEFANAQGHTYSMTKSTLWRQLKEEGLLLRFEPERTTAKATMEGVRRAVLHFSADKIFPVGDVSRFSCHSSAGSDEQPGQENGSNSHENPGSVTPVTVVTASGRDKRALHDADDLGRADDEETADIGLELMLTLRREGPRTTTQLAEVVNCYPREVASMLAPFVAAGQATVSGDTYRAVGA